MARERAKWMDQAPFWAVNAVGAPGKLCRPPMASPEPGRMIAFASFQWLIWGMSDKDRNRIERMWCRLKDWRRIATRYDKLARNFLSGAYLAAILSCWAN